MMRLISDMDSVTELFFAKLMFRCVSGVQVSILLNFYHSHL